MSRVGLVSLLGGITLLGAVLGLGHSTAMGNEECVKVTKNGIVGVRVILGYSNKKIVEYANISLDTLEGTLLSLNTTDVHNSAVVNGGYIALHGHRISATYLDCGKKPDEGYKALDVKFLGSGRHSDKEI